MLVEQVLHERAAFLEGDNDAHPEQGAPGVLATAAEHLHGDDPFLDAALGDQAQQSAFAAVVAVGGAGGDGDGAGDPLISDRPVAGITFGVVLVSARALEAMPVNARAQLAALLIDYPMFVPPSRGDLAQWPRRPAEG